VCGICGKVVASVPDKIQFMSDSGPVIFVCYACGAYKRSSINDVQIVDDLTTHDEAIFSRSTARL
jgi:hypothetical protein